MKPKPPLREPNYSITRFHIEQDARYAGTWSVYETVGSSEYQTPISEGLSKAEALLLLKALTS